MKAASAPGGGAATAGVDPEAHVGGGAGRQRAADRLRTVAAVLLAGVLLPGVREAHPHPR